MQNRSQAEWVAIERQVREDLDFSTLEAEALRIRAETVAEVAQNLANQLDEQGAQLERAHAALEAALKEKRALREEIVAQNQQAGNAASRMVAVITENGKLAEERDQLVALFEAALKEKRELRIKNEQLLEQNQDADLEAWELDEKTLAQAIDEFTKQVNRAAKEPGASFPKKIRVFAQELEALEEALYDDSSEKAQALRAYTIAMLNDVNQAFAAEDLPTKQQRNDVERAINNYKANIDTLNPFSFGTKLRIRVLAVLAAALEFLKYALLFLSPGIAIVAAKDKYDERTHAIQAEKSAKALTKFGCGFFGAADMDDKDSAIDSEEELDQTPPAPSVASNPQDEGWKKA